MPKLIVSGCSYSDRTGVEFAYGDYLAEQLGYDYLHIARGASSNYRSWFKLSRAIISGDITSDDIIVLQYTDIFRKHIPSIAPYVPQFDNETGKPIDLSSNKHPQLPGGIEYHSTPFGTAYTSDFKADSHLWQNEDENKLLHKAIQDYAINVEFDQEYFALMHRMFEALCTEYNIKLVIFINRYLRGGLCGVGGGVDPITLFGDIVRNRVFQDIGLMGQGESFKPHPNDLGYALDPDYYDNSHLSSIGHKALAGHLHTHIKGHKLLDTQ